jgi:hypothetical protein
MSSTRDVFVAASMTTPPIARDGRWVALQKNRDEEATIGRWIFVTGPLFGLLKSLTLLRNPLIGAVPRKVGKHVNVKFCGWVGSPSPAWSLTNLPSSKTSPAPSFLIKPIRCPLKLKRVSPKLGMKVSGSCFCRLIGFDVLPKHALAVRSGKSQ